MDVEQTRVRLASARVARLATRNPRGDVDLVPVTFAVRDDDTIVTAVDHKPKRTPRLQRLANIRAHPDVTLLVDHYDDDWTTLWWVRVRGRASVVEPGEPAHSSAIEALVAKYEQYRTRPPDGGAIVVEVIDIASWAAAG